MHSITNNRNKIRNTNNRRVFHNRMAGYSSLHNKHRGYTPLFSALALLLSVIVLGACPDNGDSTPTEFSYTCTNGTAVGGSTAQQSTQDNCVSCNLGYALSGTQCVQVIFQFACENGIGVPTADADAPITNTDCASCNDSYMLYTINGTNRQECASDMYGVLSNGVTIICPGVAIDSTFEFDGTTYTKRTTDITLGNADITPANAAMTCTTGISDMNTMFGFDNTFNADIGHWDVSGVSNMSNMFNSARAFNQDIGSWDVSRVNDMHDMFHGASMFNKDISDWDVSSVSSMRNMFSLATKFNQGIGGWDVSSVRDMNGMFADADMFNKDIGSWSVGRVSDMSSMFHGAAAFNQYIGDWNVSSVRNMSAMFFNAGMFNKNISDWDVSSASDMSNMFSGATAFNKNISRWCVSDISSEPSEFDTNSALADAPDNAPRWGATCQQ